MIAVIFIAFDNRKYFLYKSRLTNGANARLVMEVETKLNCNWAFLALLQEEMVDISLFCFDLK